MYSKHFSIVHNTEFPYKYLVFIMPGCQLLHLQHLVLLIFYVIIPASGQTCPAIVSYGNYWDQGQNGNLDITFPSSVSNWQVKMTFDKPLTQLNFYQGTVTMIDSKTFLIKSQSWISVQSSGSKITCGWQSWFASTPTPP